LIKVDKTKLDYDLPPFFFLFTTLKPHSGWAGFGVALTTSAMETGFVGALPALEEPFDLSVASTFRLATNSDAKRLPSRVVLLAYMVSDMISKVEGSASNGKDKSIDMISSTVTKFEHVTLCASDRHTIN